MHNVRVDCGCESLLSLHGNFMFISGSFHRIGGDYDSLKFNSPAPTNEIICMAVGIL